MRLDVEFISRWGETLNKLATITARFKRGQRPESVVRQFLDIGAQLPFDPACTPWEEVYGYQRFRAAAEANELLPVYEFLQDERGKFVSLQHSLGLHMGLFAYVDFDSGAIRYLYGPGDYVDERVDDRNKTQAHFVLKTFFEYRRPMGGDIWLEEPSWHFARMAEAFYYSRRRESGSGQATKLAFVRILDGESSEQQSAWEKELGLIYAPSGEIDACVLCWLFLHLKQTKREELAEWCRVVARGHVAAREVEPFEFSLSESAIRRFRHSGAENGGIIEEFFFWGQGRSHRLTKWLELLGLVSRSGRTGRVPVVTPKGRAVVEWLVAYLTNQIGEPLGRIEGERWLAAGTCTEARKEFLETTLRAYPVLDVDLADEEEAASTYSAKLGEPTLKGGGAERKRSVTGIREPGGASDDLEFRSLIAAVRLLLCWKPTTSSGKAARYEVDSTVGLSTDAARFEAACRMTLRAHLILRAGTRYRGMIENLPRAWIVFPVLHVDADRLVQPTNVSTVSLPALESGILRPAGFFLGTLRDLDEDGSTSPFLRESGRLLLSRRIAAIRALIQPLAEIENRETFFLDINRNKEEADRRAKTAELIKRIFEILSVEISDHELLQKVRTSIALVMLNRAPAEGVGDEALDRFELMQVFYEHSDVNKILHANDDAAYRLTFASEAAKIARNLAARLVNRDKGYGRLPCAVAGESFRLRPPADTAELAALASRLDQILLLEKENPNEARSQLGEVTMGTSQAPGFKRLFRPEEFRNARSVAEYLASHLAADGEAEILRHKILATGEARCVETADPKGVLRTDAWRSVLSEHLEERVYVAFVVPHEIPGRGAELWVSIEGKCRFDEMLQNLSDGGYVSRSNRDLLGSILRGSSGRLWVESMVPHYFYPCLLENSNKGEWNCWDLAAYIRGECPTVSKAFLARLVGAPLAKSGVRLLVRVNLSYLVA